MLSPDLVLKQRPVLGILDGFANTFSRAFGIEMIEPEFWIVSRGRKNTIEDVRWGLPPLFGPLPCERYRSREKLGMY